MNRLTKKASQQALVAESTFTYCLKWSPFCSQSFLGFIVSDLLGLQAE
jgi:hypothetical protein